MYFAAVDVFSRSVGCLGRRVGCHGLHCRSRCLGCCGWGVDAVACWSSFSRTDRSNWSVGCCSWHVACAHECFLVHSCSLHDVHIFIFQSMHVQGQHSRASVVKFITEDEDGIPFRIGFAIAGC